MTELIKQTAQVTSPVANAPTAVFIMGPTASGKTDLAVECIKQLKGDIISVDSALVYQQMNIGTAKPDAAVLQAAPHRLIDIIDPANSYSAENFRRDALNEMADIVSQGRTPILVGGTMLYYKALQEGLSKMPAANPQVRALLEQEALEKGWQHMHQRLSQVDAESAQRIHPNDPQRIQRALEVYEVTGEAMSVYWRKQKKDRLNYNVIKIALMPEDREVLRQRIAQRFELMIKQGFMDEVRNLRLRGDLKADMPSMRCVGYRQMWQHLEGELDYESMQEKAINATRQLAKRQMTWLRKEQNCNFFDIDVKKHSEIVKNLKSSLSL